MKTRIYGLIALAILAITIYSCNKDRLPNPGDGSGQEEAVTELRRGDAASVNEVRRIFAQTLAKALYDGQLRAFVHERMRRKVDTDYELIYLVEKNTVVYGGKTLSQLLAGYAAPEVFEKYGADFFEKATDIAPLLAITMPDTERVNPETWDLAVVPKVAAVWEGRKIPFTVYSATSGGDEVGSRDGEDDYFEDNDEEIEMMLGIWEAEIHYLVKSDGRTPDNLHVEDFMPSKGDATEGEKTLCASLLQQALDALMAYEVDGQQFYLIQYDQLLALYNECLALNNGGGTGSGGCQPCERDCEVLDETLVDFRINGWNVYTNIRNQLFETRFVFHGIWAALRRVNFGSTTELGPIAPVTARYVSPSLRRRDILNCDNRPCQGRWIRANYRLWTDWNEQELATPYAIDWSEVDNATTSVSATLSYAPKVKVGPVEVSLGSASIGISRIGTQTVLLGDQRVFYCDPIMKVNNTGSVQFRCN